MGDVVCVHENEEVPADLVLLKTSHAEADGHEAHSHAAHQLCFLETANIDGETHLKERLALTETARLTLDELANLQGLAALPLTLALHFLVDGVAPFHHRCN